MRELIQGKVSALIIGALLSMCVVSGTNLAMTLDAGVSRWQTYALVLLLYPLAVGLVLLAFRLQSRCLSYLRSKEKPCVHRPWLIAALLVLACWMPYFLAFFPGMFGYDSAYQLYWSIGGGALNTHHPLLHTMLLALSIKIGVELLRSATAGGMIYTLFQMLAMAVMYGWVSKCLLEVTESKRAYVFSVVWFGAFPINGMLAVSCTKDALFGAVFVVFLILLYQSLALGKSMARMVSLCVFCILTMALRNNQQYVIIALALILIVRLCVMRDKKLVAIWLCLLISIGAYNIIHGPVLDAFGVNKNSTLRESMSVPLQQLASVRKADGNLTSGEREYVDTLIPGWNDYLPGISDPVKASLNSEFLQSDARRFITTYLQVVCKNINESQNAFLRLNYRQWYPFALGRWSREYGHHPFLETNVTGHQQEFDRLGILYLMPQNHSYLPLFKLLVSKAFSSCAWDWVPILWPIMSTGAIVWWYIIALGWLSNKNEKALALTVAVLLLYWATLLLGPVTLARYEYPLWSCFPLLTLQAKASVVAVEIKTGGTSFLNTI